jgi:hypothetical protein
MSSDRDTTRIVRSWLEEGVNALPDRALDEVLDRLPTTPQRRHFWQAWRNPTVTDTVKYALGGAAVLVLAVLAIGIYVGQSGGPGVPGPTPSSTPSSAPVASQGPSPTAQLTPEGLAPGTYPMRPEPFLATSPSAQVTVPAGYDGQGNSEYAWAITKAGAEPTAFSGLAVWQVDAVYEDPCRWSATDVDGQSLGPTVDDFVAALVTQPDRNATPPLAVAVDGYSGLQLQLSVPSDIAFDEVTQTFPDCDEGQYWSWPGRWHQAPSQIDDIRVVDVDGTRLIIATTYFTTTSSQDRAELEAMFQSLDIQP